jgi:hypothetical protein
MCEPMTCSNSRTSLGVIFVKDASTVNRNLCDAQCIGAVEQPIDTGAAAGKCLLDMLGVVAQFEEDWKASPRPQPRSAQDVPGRGSERGREPIEQRLSTSPEHVSSSQVENRQ